MRKNFLRLGALALMSVMSIGAWAQNANDVITLDNNTLNGANVAGKYRVLPDGATVKLEKATGDANSIYAFPDPTETPDIKGSGWIKSQTGRYFKVVEIGANAFDGIKNATLTIPSTVTTIGEKAFAWMGDGTSATACSITFDNPSCLTSLGNSAFNADEATTSPARHAGSSITITNPVIDLSHVANYGTYVFDGVTFTNATVKLGEITTVPEGLFCNASGIMVVDFGNDGANGGGLTEISKKAFYGVTSIQSFGYGDTDGKYYLPKNLTTVGDDAFNGALHATPTTTEFLFSRTNVGKITNVGAGAFKGCKVIDNAHFENLFVSGNSIAGLTYNPHSFNDCSLTETLDLSTSMVTSNNSKRYIPSYAFANNAVTQVKLPADLKVIGEAAFLGCSSLEFCALPAGLEKIEASAFKNADAYGATLAGSPAAIVPVIIPNTVTFIGKDAFSRDNENSSALDRIIKIQPKENIAQGRLDKSQVIESWEYVGIVKTATNPIADYSKTNLYVPMGLSKSYATVKTGEYDWSNAYDNATTFEHLYTYGSALTATTSKIYNGCYEYTVKTTWDPKYTEGRTETPEVELTGVKLSVESLSGSAYTKQFASDEKTLNIPQTVVKEGENSGDNSFVWYTVVGVNANALQHTTVKNSVTYGLKKQIETVNIQADALDLTGVFTGYEKLATVNFCALQATDNTNGWAGAKDLKPKNVTLGPDAFKDCAKLANFNAAKIDGAENADYNSGLKYSNEIGVSAFENDKALKNFVITEGVTLLDTWAFYKTGLTSINIPNSVNVIRSQVFDAALNPDADDFVGVRDITVNWNAGDARTFYINADAFGNEISHWRGSKLEYLPRRLYIPAGSSAFYNNTGNGPFWDAHKFTLGEAIVFESATNPSGRLDVSIDVDNTNQEIRKLTLTDDNTITKLEVPTEDPKLIINYTRVFKNTNQQAWFVPFTLSANQKQGATFYKIYDTKVVDEGGKTVTSLELVEEKGDIKANRPYIVVPAAAEQVIFAAVGIVKTDDSKVISVSDIANTYTVQGNYTEKSGPENSFYALASNKFSPNKASAKLKACRLFMTSAALADPYAIKINILSDEDVTAIENVKANNANGAMFDLMGRQITAPAKGQVYIQDGVKKLAK